MDGSLVNPRELKCFFAIFHRYFVRMEMGTKKQGQALDEVTLCTLCFMRFSELIIEEVVSFLAICRNRENRVYFLFLWPVGFSVLNGCSSF